MAILREREVWKKPKTSTPRYTPNLTDEERANIRKALQVLRRRHGSWKAVAEAMGVHPLLPERAGAARGKKPSVALALRAARLAGVSLEEILSGSWPKPGACPMCGRA